MVYKLGEWKLSTIATLERLTAENDKGNRPKSAFFRNGAIAHWLKLLKEGGYIDNGNGYSINQKGVALLNELKNNPPRARVPKNTKSQEQNNARKSEQGTSNDSFTVDISNKSFRTTFTITVSQSKLWKALAVFQSELKK